MYYKSPILQLLIEAKTTTKWTTINLKKTNFVVLECKFIAWFERDDFFFWGNLSNIQKIVVVTMHA
jgi:hypothetical protein